MYIMAMELIFIRHGQTDFNKNKIPQGQEIDVGLNEEGIRQVEAAAANVPEHVDVFFSSPLKRAFQSAEIINAKFKMPIQIHDGIKEFSYGSLAGKPWPQIEEETGGRATRAADQSLAFDYRAYGGESIDDLKKRVLAFVEEMKATYPDKTVLVAAHGGVIGAMHLLFPQAEQAEVVNAGVHRFQF